MGYGFRTTTGLELRPETVWGGFPLRTGFRTAIRRGCGPGLGPQPRCGRSFRPLGLWSGFPTGTAAVVDGVGDAVQGGAAARGWLLDRQFARLDGRGDGGEGGALGGVQTPHQGRGADSRGRLGPRDGVGDREHDHARVAAGARVLPHPIHGVEGHGGCCSCRVVRPAARGAGARPRRRSGHGVGLKYGRVRAGWCSSHR